MLMSSLSFVVCLGLGLVCCQDLKEADRDPHLSGFIFTDNLLFERKAKHDIDCARLCSKTDRCVTFTFTPVTSGDDMCRGHSARMNSSNANQVSAGTDLYDFRLDTKNDSTAEGPCWGVGCTTNSDCAGNMTACFSGQCLCDGGYFFSHSQCACVQTCAAFHPSSYSVYSMYYFNYHDISSETAGLSAQDCQDQCTATTGCLMASRFDSGATCYTKDATAQDFPDDWALAPSGFVCAVYQRTCL